jgi:hypothetical protein
MLGLLEKDVIFVEEKKNERRRNSLFSILEVNTPTIYEICQ